MVYFLKYRTNLLRNERNRNRLIADLSVESINSCSKLTIIDIFMNLEEDMENQRQGIKIEIL